MTARDRVAIGWSDSGSVRGEFALAMLYLQDWERDHPDAGYELMLPARSVGTYVQESRNSLVRHALAQGADWVLQLDADESFSPALLRMLMSTAAAVGASVVTGLYANVQLFPQELSDGSLAVVNCVYAEAEDGFYTAMVPPADMSPFRVDAAGAGCLLVHRSVFEAVGDPYFWVEWAEPADGDAQMVGEDFAFCRRAREAGFEIWCNPLAEVMHWKTLPLLASSVRDFMAQARKAHEEMSAHPEGTT